MSESRPAERPIKLLQGYVWFPKTSELDLRTYLPERLDDGVHVLIDRLPAAPFSFFDDGTSAATQHIHQLTVVTMGEDEASVEPLLPWAAEVLEEKLESTPAEVGWQILDDLRTVQDFYGTDA